MSTEARPQQVSLTRTAQLVITVRVSYADGQVHYYEVRGASNGEDAVQIARQQAELERPGIALYTAGATNAIDQDP